MEAVLWYVLAGTRGGANRLRIVRALDERPRNANQLADEIDLSYKTVRHHLDVLKDHDLVKDSGDDYGAIYLLTEDAQDRWDVIAEITDQMLDT